MSQHDYVIANGTGAAVRSDLNGALAAIVSNNSGATAPSTTYAYQWWADTTTGLLKLRNAANNAWITLFQLDGEWSTLAVENGSASAPSIYFKDSGTDTGIYSPGADQVAISTNGSGRLFVDSSGRVGAGTSSPGGQLEVFLTSATDPALRLRYNSSSYYADHLMDGNGNYIIYSPAANGVTSGNLRIRAGSSFSVSTNNQAATSPALTIDTSSRVGIGSNNPQSLLHLETDGTALRIVRGSSTGFVYNTGTSLTSPTRLQSNDGSVDIYTRVAQPITFTTNDSEKARLDSSGRLLVGTSSTSGNERLYIANSSSTATGVYIHNTNGATNSSSDLWFGNYSNASTSDIYTARISAVNTNSSNAATDLRFWTYSGSGSSAGVLERMRIRSSGEVLINQTSTLGVGIPLQASGTAADWVSYFSNSRSPDPYGVQIHYNAAAPNGTSSEFLYCRDNAALRASIRSNGGLANFQANNVNLSDRNAKKDISPATGTWDCIKEWEIVNYRYKDQPDDADLNLGVIAQQVAESCPEVITVFEEAKEDQPEKLGIKEQQMYWMAIKALQEAQVRIETLEAKVAALEAA